MTIGGRCFQATVSDTLALANSLLSRLRMRNLSTFLFTTVIAASIAACASSPTSPTDPAIVTMAPGQSTQVGLLSVKFVGVTIDTRCPANAICIQAGDAFVALETNVLGGRRDFELQVLNPTKRSTTHGNYSIELQEVSPYPFGQPIRPADYRVKLRIARDNEPARR